MIIFKFKLEQTILALTYAVDKIIFNTKLNSLNLFSKAYPALFYAEQFHLVNWAVPITGDTWKCGLFGPIPITTHNIIMSTIAGIKNEETAMINKYLDVSTIENKKLRIKNKISIDLDEVSESRIECLNKSIEWCSKCISMDSFIAMDSVSIWEDHDPGYLITYDSIALRGGASNEQMEYIKLQAENDMFI